MNVCPTNRHAGYSALLLALMPAIVGIACSSAPKHAEKRGAPDSLLSSGARSAFSQGEYEAAARLYERALDRATVRDDAPSQADAAYGLAVCRSRLRQWDAARSALGRGRSVLAADQSARAADFDELEARIALRQGDSSTVRRLVTRHLAETSASGHEANQASWLVIRGEEAVARDIEQSRRDLAAAEVLVTQPRPDLERLRGLILNRTGDHAGAASCFDSEAGLLRVSGDHPSMAEALERAGRAWSEAGSPETAADRLVRAGESLCLQGMRDEGRRAFEAALVDARRANRADLIERAESGLRAPQ